MSAAGATSVRITELEAKELAVDGSGAIKMEIAGRTVAQTIRISGAGDYRAADLASETAKVTVSGAGRVAVRVDKTLDVDLSGAAAVEYVGDPKSHAADQRRRPREAARRDINASMDPERCRSGNRLRLEQQRQARAVGAVGVHTREGSDVRHPAIAQQVDEHGDDVARAIERIERDSGSLPRRGARTARTTTAAIRRLRAHPARDAH